MLAPIIFVWHLVKFSTTVSTDLKRLLTFRLLIIAISFIQTIDARSFGGAKAFCFLFIWQWLSSMSNIFRGSRIWWLHHNEFGLITLCRFILLISFLGHFGFHWWWSCIKSSKQCSIYIYIYIYIYTYIPVKVKKRMSLKQSQCYDVENSTPQWDSNQRSFDYISNSIYSRHVSDHQNNASQIYFEKIRGSKPRYCIKKWQKI